MTDYLTKEGLEKLQKELEHLKTVRRPEVIERIHRAKELGDLSENAEYADAKNEQGFIEGRIVELQNLINKAEIINESSETGVVALGSTVRIECDGEEKKYMITKKLNLEPGESVDIPLSKEVPAGTYGVTIPPGSSDEGNKTFIESVPVTDKRSFFKKAGQGLKSITGAYTGSGIISSRPHVASVLLVLIVLGMFLFYSRGVIRRLFKKE